MIRVSNHSRRVARLRYPLAVTLVPLLALLVGAGSPGGSSCCPPHPVDMTQFLLRPLSTGPCNPTNCVNQAPVCAVSLGCGADDQCKYSLEQDASCACYETDFRICPDSSGVAQACARTSSTSTVWQVDGSNRPVCGPTQVSCTTNRPACPTGHKGTKYDPTVAAWVPDPNAACTADPPCPQTGATRTCKTGNARCPDGIQTFDGNAWSTTCTPQNCSMPSCVSNVGAGCGCGGTIGCDGRCSAPGPGNLGAPCGCGGTIGCDGRCSHDCPVEHRLGAVFSNIDDDAYVWLDHPGTTDQAICRINSGDVPRNGQCDLQSALHSRGVNSGRLVFKIGNGGGFNSKGTIQILVDGNQRWRGGELDNGWKHTGWTYCSKVDVDLASGNVREQCTSSCALWLDCDNDCKGCP